MKSDPTSTPYTKIDSKWIIDLNVRAKAIKLLEENMGVNLHDLGLGGGFLDMAPKAQTTEEKLDRWTSKLKAFVLPSTLSRN